MNGALPSLYTVLVIKYLQVEEFRDSLDAMVRYFWIPMELTGDKFWATGTTSKQIIKTWGRNRLAKGNYMGKLLMLVAAKAWALPEAVYTNIWENGNWGVNY